jgi:hypothetical protein
LSMYNGFNIVPERCIPEVMVMDTQQLKIAMDKLKFAIEQGVKCAPSHKEFLLQI